MFIDPCEIRCLRVIIIEVCREYGYMYTCTAGGYFLIISEVSENAHVENYCKMGNEEI